MRKAKLKIIPSGIFAGQAINSIPINDLYALTRTEEFDKFRAQLRQEIRFQININKERGNLF